MKFLVTKDRAGNKKTIMWPLGIGLILTIEGYWEPIDLSYGYLGVYIPLGDEMCQGLAPGEKAVFTLVKSSFVDEGDEEDES